MKSEEIVEHGTPVYLLGLARARGIRGGM